LFGGIWIGAAIAFFYFLYGALANEAPISHLFWSIGVGLIARYLAVTFNSKKEQVDYVDQLMGYGYTHSEATTALETAIRSWSSLLIILQQADSVAATDRRDDERSNSNAE
jgi:hypothetical protein